MEQILTILKSLIEPSSIIIVSIVLLFLNSWIFQRIKIVKSYGNIMKNTISVFVIFIGMLVFIFSFPISQ